MYEDVKFGNFALILKHYLLMLFSMTGFGRNITETSDKKLIVEIKSLNSKQLDLTVRLPIQFREQENEIRNIVAAKLQRGKVDLIITSESKGETAAVDFNMPALKAYKKQISQMAEVLGIPQPSDWYSVLLRFPDSLHSDNATVADSDDANALLQATSQAVDTLMAYRRTEGQKLEDFFEVRIRRIRELLGQIPMYEKERLTKIRARIEDNLSKLSPIEYDKGRFEQEMIFYIEKLDINEEKQRLSQHLDYFIETMRDQEGGQGKKLGFISQEMGREINTLGSKSNHAEMQKIVVRMKDELEQIKEQVLNVM